MFSLLVFAGRLRGYPGLLGSACLLIAILLGGLNGAEASRRSRQACPAALLTGDRVVASGIVTNRAAAGAGSRRILRLTDVDILLAEDGRTCAVAGLLVRVSGRSEVPTAGSRVRIEGEWMRLAGSGRWPSRPERQGLVTGLFVGIESGVGHSLATRSKSAMAERLVAHLPPDVAPTALALVLAERDELDPELRRRFASAGLAHLLAISGMHVGLLAAGMLWLLRWFVGPRRRIIALVLVAGYVLMIGAPVAASRALIVFAGYIWAGTRGWPARAGELLGLAALTTLILDPLSLSDPGFQLSYAGFSGVLIGNRLTRLSGPVADRGRAATVRRGLTHASIVSSCALLATSPFTAWHFGQITPVALIAHLVGAPLIAVSLGSLFPILVLPGPFTIPAAAVATGTIRLLHLTVGWFSAIPLGHSAVAAPDAAIWAFWVLAIVAVLQVVISGVPRAAVRPGLIGMALYAVAPLVHGLPGGHSMLCTLSVGQGDAAVLRTRRGHWMVFDGGSATRDWDAGKSILIPFLRRHGASRVDVVILSHPDLDHLGGLVSLLNNMPIGRLVDTGDPVPSAAYERFLAAVDASSTRWLPAAPGDQLQLDDAQITVLGPPGDSTRLSGSPNATSVTFRLTMAGGFRYVNTGDATMREEYTLLASWPVDSLRADLLKVGHHGSRTSSAVRFVRAVGPDLAVISSGVRNPYGHPHAETLARLDSAGVVRVWRTDRNGTLCVEIDARGWWRVRGEGAWRDPAGAS